MDKVAEQDLIIRTLRGWQFVRENHGSLYDRGMADSYYGRSRQPHYGGVGAGSGDRVAVTDQASVQEYTEGFEYNERCGDKKNWG